MIKGVTHARLGPIWYNSEPSDVPHSPNQVLGWDFFAVSYSKTALADVCFFLQDGNGKVSTDEYQQWYKKVVEVDSDIEDDFDVADFNYFDLDGDGSITMKELITKLNPSASIIEKEELAVIVSSAPNFDLDGDRNINMSEMITNLNPLPEFKENKEVSKPICCSFGMKLPALQLPEPTLTLREMNPKLNPLAQDAIANPVAFGQGKDFFVLFFRSF